MKTLDDIADEYEHLTAVTQGLSRITAAIPAAARAPITLIVERYQRVNTSLYERMLAYRTTVEFLMSARPQVSPAGTRFVDAAGDVVLPPLAVQICLDEMMRKLTLRTPR